MLEALRWGWGAPPVPMLLQTEAAECGLACVAMVAAHHGLRSDLATLRQRFSLSLKGATLGDLVRIAGALQLNARPLRAELEHLPQLHLPCILHWDLNHFVVLTGVQGRGAGRVAVIHDPARGVRRLPLAEVSRHFTGVVLELSPGAGFEPHTERQRIGLRQLLGPVRGLRRSLGQVFVLALVLELFVLLGPFFLQWVVDGALLSGDRDLLLTLVVGFSLLMLLQVATGALRSWAVLYLSSTLNLQWLGNVFAHLMRLPVAWFEKRHAGDVISRFRSLKPVQEFITGGVVATVIDGAMALTTLIVIFVYSPLLAGIAIGAFVPYAAGRFALLQPLLRRSHESIAADARLDSHFLETIRALQGVKLFGKEAERERAWQDLFVDSINAGVRVARLNLGYDALNGLLLGIGHVLEGAVWTWDYRATLRSACRTLPGRCRLWRR